MPTDRVHGVGPPTLAAVRGQREDRVIPGEDLITMIIARLLSAIGRSSVVAMSCVTIAGPSALARATTAQAVFHSENDRAAVWPHEEGLPARFELEQVFGADMHPAAAMLGGISGVAVDESGNVFIVDYRSGRLVSFAEDGSVRWSSGRKGEGPGEFNRPGSLVIVGDELLIMNGGGTRIDLWNTSGEYIRTQRLVDAGVPRARLIGLQSPDALIVNRRMPTALGTKVSIINIEGAWEVVGEFKAIVEDNDAPLFNQSISLSATLVDGMVWVGNKGSYILRGYDLQGRLIRTISVAAEYLQEPGFHTGDAWVFVDLGELRAPVALPSGHLLVYASWPTNVEDPAAFARRRAVEGRDLEIMWACSLDLFDANGEFVGSTVWEGTREPRFGRPAIVGPQGRLYTVATDAFPQVRRYRVQIDG